METPTQWRQPAAQSSAWRSPIQSVQRLLFSFSYTDPEENVRTALTCNDPLSEAAGPEAAPRQPWDRQELLKRLRTFRPGTWFGKPSQASAVACAAHGWTNSAADVLKCPACQQTLAFTASSTLHGHDADTLVQDFVAQLSSKHEAFCVWHDQGSCASNEILPFPAAPQKLVCEAFVGRIAELGQLEGLPCLGGLGIATMTSQCLAQLMALLDATAVPLQPAESDAVNGAIHAAHSSHGTISAHQHRQQQQCEAMPLTLLSRRSCAFSLAAKVIAALGWRVRPLSKRAVGTSGHYAAADCMLACPTCAAAVGLWSLKEAPETQGTLGTSGLLGQWGAGAAKPRQSAVRMLSIAGGLDPHDGAVAAPAGNPWLPSSTVLFGSPGSATPAASAGPRVAASAPAEPGSGSPGSAAGTSRAAPAPAAPALQGWLQGGFGSIVPFGSGALEAPFGAKVSLASNAFLHAKPAAAAAASPAVARSARGSAAGADRSRSGAADGASTGATDAGRANGAASTAANRAASRKRKRDADSGEDTTAAPGEDAAGQSRAKIAKLIRDMFDENLPEDVAAQLRAAGLPLGRDDACFDPVMSHRAWCALHLPGMHQPLQSQQGVYQRHA